MPNMPSFHFDFVQVTIPAGSYVANEDFVWVFSLPPELDPTLDDMYSFCQQSGDTGTTNFIRACRVIQLQPWFSPLNVGALIILASDVVLASPLTLRFVRFKNAVQYLTNGAPVT